MFEMSQKDVFPERFTKPNYFSKLTVKNYCFLSYAKFNLEIIRV